MTPENPLQPARSTDLADEMIRASTPAEPEPDTAIFGTNIREAAHAFGILRRWWAARAVKR